MIKYLLAALFLPFSLVAQIPTLESITHDGLDREYLLYIPDSYEEGTPMPLVFNFHGRGSTPNEQFAYTLLTTVASEEGFIVVYPKGTLDPTDISFWNAGFDDVAGVDDVGFTIAILDELIAELSIDESRVYSTGMSNGGYFSYKLACEHSDRFAAIASVTGSMVLQELESCDPERAVPVMQIHGTADLVVAYDGLGFSAPIEDVVDFWVEVNNCDPTPVFTAIEDTDTEDGSTAEHYYYENSDNGNSVEFYKVIGGGHTWPGAEFIIGVTNQDFNASEVIWNFFKAHTLIEDIDSGIEAVTDLRVFPNPVLNDFYVELEVAAEEIRIYDVEGCAINIDLRLENNLVKIDATEWAKGVYLVSQYDTRGNIVRVDRIIK